MVAVFSSVQLSYVSAGALRSRPHDFVSVAFKQPFILLFDNTPERKKQQQQQQQQDDQEQPSSNRSRSSPGLQQK